jgi:isopenicillin N synthase-like dioxygenase
MSEFKKSVPCVDVRQYTEGHKADKQQFVKLFGNGLREFGFVVVEGHQVSPQLIANAYAKIKAFFDLSSEIKAKYEVAGGMGQRGYTSFGKEHAKTSAKGDLKEFWHVGREHFENAALQKIYAPNLWPDTHVADFRKVTLELYQQLDAFAATLLEATSEFLGLGRYVLPNMVKDGNSIIRALHYPPIADEHYRSGAVRAAAHEDINFITILCEATQSGLEILTRDGQWLPIEVGPGQMVVDSGDMLSRICNDVIPSTTHRVVNPPNGKNVSRYSMPFFVHAYPTCELNVLSNCVSPSRPAQYSPCTANEFLTQRLREIGLA